MRIKFNKQDKVIKALLKICPENRFSINDYQNKHNIRIFIYLI